MELLLLLLLFAAVSHGDSEVRCDARQVQSSQRSQRSQCSVGLGRTAFIQLMSNASGLNVKCRKNHSGDPSQVFTVKKDKVTMFGDRMWFFVLNGTFHLRQAELSDAGEYILEAYSDDGLLHTRTRLQLSVTGKTRLQLSVTDNGAFPLPLLSVTSVSSGLVLIVLYLL